MPMLRQMGYSIPRLLGYMSEQAIYMVNSFQFTRSARLILAYRPLGSGLFQTLVTAPSLALLTSLQYFAKTPVL
jgi:hypothetical protein